jgi:hypothetical protein
VDGMGGARAIHFLSLGFSHTFSLFVALSPGPALLPFGDASLPGSHVILSRPAKLSLHTEALGVQLICHASAAQAPVE